MSDEKFEEFLQREAEAYNAPPPAVPRDEMWAAIAQARAARRPMAGGATVTPIGARRPRPRYVSWIGMAATLLVGIGIGRFAMRDGTATPGASPPFVATATGSDMPDAAAPGAGASGAAPPAAAGVTTPTAPDAARPATSLAPRARPADAPLPAVRLASAPATEAAAVSPYQVASQRHLANAEALVSAVATTPRDAMIDSLTGRWARDMLTNTRLLLDSPAGEDPIRRRLLEDLETLLVQLVQRSGAAAEERALIDRTLEKTQLLTRLRSGAAGI